MTYKKILVRATNWVGDAVMSLPALRALRGRFPDAHISILAKPWVADLYHREPFCDEMIPYTPKSARDKLAVGRDLKEREFDCAILLQNAFEAAAIALAAGIPERIGYARDGRSPLLTRAIPVPKPGEIPPHERFYYLELLHRAGILDSLPENDRILLDGAPQAREAGRARFTALNFGPKVIGLSPGAAFGSAKRYLPERFAEAANKVAEHRLRFSVLRKNANCAPRSRRPYRSPSAIGPAKRRWASSSKWRRPALSIFRTIQARCTSPPRWECPA